MLHLFPDFAFYELLNSTLLEVGAVLVDVLPHVPLVGLPLDIVLDLVIYTPRKLFLCVAYVACAGLLRLIHPADCREAALCRT